MSLYVPESRRRRRLLLTAAAALLVGLTIGVLTGRLSAPSVADQVAAVRAEAQQTSAGLRVVALHDQAGVGGDGGTRLIPNRTRAELHAEFSRAPWVTQSEQSALLAQLAALEDRADSRTASFGDAADALAKAIDDTFGR